MDAAADEPNPPDLLASVSIDSNSTSVKDDSIKDHTPPVNTEDADLIYKINNLHCPFIWKPEDSLTCYNQDSVEEIMNVDEIIDETSSFKLRRFVIHLILCYNNFCKRLLEKSLKNLDEIEKMLLTSMKNRSQDVYFSQINVALFHILNSCRVVMFHTTNQKEKAQQVLQKITPYEDLNPTNQAGIWAVRANLYVEFGYYGIKAAIQYIERSTEIDPDNPYWHFTRGMYLGRLRRIESGLTIPSRDEIASLELAMKLKNDASFMAFAAEVYVETVNRSKKKSQELLLFANEKERRNLEEKNNMINERAVMLFKKSVDMNSNCAHVLFRCGKGMLKLAPPYQDVHLAYEYLKKGLELSYESSFGNHAMAMYYMKQENNSDMAKKYLIKATESKNFGADIDLIRVNFLDNRDPEKLLDSLMKLFDRYQDKMKHGKILAEIISYYLFIDYNLTEVIKHMNKLLYLIGDHDNIINVFKSGILRQKFPVSLLEILLSDIADRSNKNTLNADEQEECRKLMQRLCFQNISLPSSKTGNLRKNLMKEIKAKFEEVKVNKVTKSSTRTTEKHTRKDYNPAEGRFEKEYAQKYYAQEEPKRNEKTVVDEFFEKYEAATAAGKVKSCSSTEKGCQDGDKFHPIVQKLFTKLKDSQKKGDSSNELSEGDEEMMTNIAKRLDFHLRISAHSESKQTRTTKDGASTSRRSDDFDDVSVHRRRSSRSPRKRSKSRERRQVGKDSSSKRSDSRESYRSTKESYRKRSPSTESRYSTRHSRRRRSPSRESRRNRSPSLESNISYRTGGTSSRRRSKSREDFKSSRRRSFSRESKYSVSSNRQRSTSRNRRSTSRAEKHSRRGRSKSNESVRSCRETIGRRRSISREIRRSPIVEHSRRKRSVSKELSRRRSMSRESRQSSSRRKRSLSRESRQSLSLGKRSMSRESRQTKTEHSRRKRSVSRESRRSLNSEHERRRRSISKESLKSDKERSQKKNLSPETHRSSKAKKYQRERSISSESHRSNIEPRPSSNIKENSKLINCDNLALDGSNSETIPIESKKPIPSRDRSRSRESLHSRKRSPPVERKNRCGKSKNDESDQSFTEVSSNNSDYDRIKSKKSHRSDRYQDERDYHRRTRPRSYSSDETRSIHSRRSSSKESRRSKRISSRDRRNRSRKSKKDESDYTLTEFSSNDSDYDRSKLKKSHRSDRYQKDELDYRRRIRSKSYSSDETRSIRSRRSSSKESRRSKNISSRDRSDDYRRKCRGKKYRKYSSSEDISSGISESSFEEVDRLPKSSHRCRRSSRNEDFRMNEKRKKDHEKSENQGADEKVISSCSSSTEKQNDPNQDDKSDPENDAQKS